MITFEGKDIEYSIKSEQFVDQVIRSYLANTKTCSVCRCFPRSPVTINNVGDEMGDIRSPCGHLFCDGCVRNWIYNHNTCPVCRQHSNVSDIVQAVGIEQELGDLVSSCKYKSRGCDWSRSIGKSGRDYLLHVKSCKFRSDPCDLCKAQVSDLKMHMSVCPEALIECLDSRCKVWVPRKDFDKHRGECMYRLVRCPRQSVCSAPCCQDYFTLDELKEHERLCMPEHLATESELRRSAKELLDLSMKKVTSLLEERKVIRNLLTESRERVICSHQYKLMVPLWYSLSSHGDGKSQTFDADPDPDPDVRQSHQMAYDVERKTVKQWIMTAKRLPDGKARLDLTLKSASYPRAGKVTVYLANDNDHLALPTKRLNYSTVKAVTFDFSATETRPMIKADGSLTFIVVVESKFHPHKPKGTKVPKAKEPKERKSKRRKKESTQ
jgi:hypothetical protein